MGLGFGLGLELELACFEGTLGCLRCDRNLSFGKSNHVLIPKAGFGRDRSKGLGLVSGLGN